MTPSQQRPSEFTTVRFRKHAIGLLLANGLLLTGCSDNNGSSNKATDTHASSQPAASSADTQSSEPQAAQKAAVLASYRSMWSEQMKAYRKADATGTDLTKYASLTALGKFRLDLAHMKQNGTVIKGEMGHENTKVTALDLSAKTPMATVTDCIDLSKWQTYDVKAKKVIPLPSAQPLRYVATAKTEQWNGRWMVIDYTPDGEQPC